MSISRLFALVTLAATLPGASAPIELDVLLSEGDPAPDTTGSVTRVFKGSTNNTGEVIIGGRTSVAGRAVWAGDPNALQLLAEEGQASPGPGNQPFTELTNFGALYPIINDNGDSAFIGNTNGVGTGIFTHVGGVLGHIASHGEPVAGVPGATHLMNFGNLESTAFDLTGASTFHNIITDGGVTNDDNAILSSGVSGGVQLLAREGALLDGETDISFATGNNIYNETHTSSSGLTAYCANLTGPGAGSSSTDSGIILGSPGNFTLALQAGDPAVAPGLPPDAQFRGPAGNYPVRVNNAGELLFISTLEGTGISGNLTAGTGNNIAIWSGTPGSFRIVARRGDPAPDLPAGIEFTIYESLTPNANALALASTGDSVFFSQLRGPVTSSDNAAVFAEIEGTLHLVAREGNPAPELPAGVLFNGFNPSVGVRFAINGNGVVLLLADLIGTGITGGNDKALYFWSAGDGLQLIAHEGGQIETSPGTFQTVGSLSLNGTMGDDSAHGRNLNNRNEAVFATTLDGDEALLRAKLVIPATYQLAHADTHSSAGGVITSANYASAATTGHLAGMAGSSANYLGKPGFAGQLYAPASILVAASPDPVDEEATTQAAATVVMDDSTILPLANSDPAWEVMAGPFTGITTTGVATAGAVYQNEPATLRATYAGISGDGLVTIADSNPDNYQDYASDGIDDDWQVTHFGLPPNTDAAPGENPDGDPYDNLFEFLTGYSPVDGADFFTLRVSDKAPGFAEIELSKVIPGTRYTLERSTTLAALSWFEVDEVTPATTETDFKIPDNSAPDQRAFYRVDVSTE